MFIENKYKKWYYQIIDNRFRNPLDNRLYTEKHHIIPKSLGGDDTIHNTVRLTGREHFLVHMLLAKCTIGDANRKMVYAIRMMTAQNKYHQRHTNSILYEATRISHAAYMSELHTGKVVSPETRKKMSDAAKARSCSHFKGKTHSEYSRQLMSIAHKGHQNNTPDTVSKILKSRSWYTHSDTTKQKISDGNKGKVVIHTDESKQKISDALKGRIPTWLKDKPAHNRGIPHSDATIQKLKDAAANRIKICCPHCCKHVDKANYTRWHGENCKQFK